MKILKFLNEPICVYDNYIDDVNLIEGLKKESLIDKTIAGQDSFSENQQKLYEIVNKDFRQTYKLKIVKELKKHLEDHIPKDICKKVNNRFFITYNNIKKGKKTIKSMYKNVDEIINTIIKSSYIPFLIDGNVLYENKYNFTHQF